MFQFLVRKLLTLAISSYVEDIFCCGPPKTCTSGFWAFKALAILSGSPTPAKKDQAAAREVFFLGATAPLDSTSIQACACPARIRKLRGALATALHAIKLPPANASKLRGRLGFYTPLLAGELGNGMMGDLIYRQY